MDHSRLKKLDGLRGIFSLMIVVYHYDISVIPESIYNNFILRESYFFVDFFFVLSGFVITMKYKNMGSVSDFATFMKKRFVRLFPLLLYTTLLFVFVKIFFSYVLPQFIYSPEPLGILAIKTLDTLLFLNSTPLIPMSEGGINIPSWSISAEMIAYTVFALTVLLLKGRTRDWFFGLLTIFSIYILFKYGATANYSFLRGIISFNLGYFIFKISKMDFKIRNDFQYLLPVFMILLMSYINTVNDPVQVKIFQVMIMPLFFALFLLVIQKSDSYISALLDHNFFQFLGKISYSMYLNHIIVISFLPRLFFDVLGIQPNRFSQILVFLFCIYSVLVYSRFTYEFVEMRGGAFLRKILKRNKLTRVAFRSIFSIFSQTIKS